MNGPGFKFQRELVVARFQRLERLRTKSLVLIRARSGGIERDVPHAQFPGQGFKAHSDLCRLAGEVPKHYVMHL